MHFLYSENSLSLNLTSTFYISIIYFIKPSPMKNILKKAFLLLSLLICAGAVHSQSWTKNIKEKKSSNFYTYQKAFNDYWKNKDVDNDEELNCSEGGWQQFKRWENFMEPRVYPNGKFFDQKILWSEWNKYKSKNKTSAKAANWELLGPSVVPGNGGGNGRVNCICFHPTDPNTFWVGSPSGGIWKTTDGGSSWISLNANLLTNLSIADIAVDPSNPDILYLATGDGYGYEVENIFWGGTYSAGVLKSIDGGTTWNATGLAYIQSQNNIIQRIVVCPTNTQVLLASARDGMWRSADGGTTWTKVQTAHFFDIKFNATDNSIIYASSETEVFKSTDLGLTWTQLSSGLNSTGGRISLAVTAANPLVIYAFCNGSGDQFYKSSDGGTTFQLMTSPDNTGSFYGYYDMVLAASPADANTVYAGGMEVIKSTDGGTSWTKVSDWAGWPGSAYVHADNHDIEFLPGSGNTVFSCNDGGIFKTTDGATSWTDISNGLNITQYYRLGCSATNSDIVYLGAQDNGTDRFDGTSWTQVYGADGMETVVDYTDENTVYVSYQGGAINKSTDGGNSFTDISPTTGGAWTTPYVMDPFDHLTLYAGYSDVYKTTDGGASWNAISTNLTGGGTLRTLAVANSNTNYIYAGILSDLYMTSNGGTSWSSISAGLPVSSTAITGIAISDSDPQSIWVTFSGYVSGEKVYYSANAGTSWTNVSGTLPNIPVNCIVYENNSPDAIYIGTDFGVFYSDNTMNDFIAYNNGLPNVMIDELEIQYDASKIRAATYGRGLWQSDLNSTVQYNTDAGVSALLSVPSSTCDTILTPDVKIKNFGLDTLTSVTVNYQLDGGTISNYSWNGSLATNLYAQITLPSVHVSAGSHSFTAYTSNPNGTADGNANNNSKTVNFTVISSGQAMPIVEGFEGASYPPAGWSSSAWNKSSAAGGFGNSSNSTMIDFYNLSTGNKGKLYTDYINMSSMSSPVLLRFDRAYARYNSVYSDTLIIKISVDCGLTYNTIWTKGGTDLATAIDVTSPYVPAPAEWLNEIIDLSSYIGMEKVKILFEGHSGYGNDLYLDNINISGPTGINENKGEDSFVNIYPNPTTGDFFVDFKSDNVKNITISIFNAIGEKIKMISLANTDLQQHISFNLSDQAKGIYFVKIETDKTTTNKVIAVK